MHQPEYFERVQSEASKTWDKLRDPNIAGLAHNQFKDVQSARHVISELLQNADDAKATNAKVEITNDELVFSHNGDDFSEEQFASLCGFGFSNKRTLHTIGFRGIGFKSTFSLGDNIRLVTPTLSVTFNKQKFVVPVWTESHRSDGRIEVRVAITNQLEHQELLKNLQEWRERSFSLLFFSKVRSLRLNKQEIKWESQGDGPVKGSEWMSVSEAPNNQCLIIRSPEEEFPEDALNEIMDERMTTHDNTLFPTCSVKIVLGAEEGRLFAVLPTDVTIQLPFACNAPFIQNSARTTIRDPSSCHTNRWLLRRIGQLAADTMLAWVASKHLPVEERCKGYKMFPVTNSESQTTEGISCAIVKESFETRIKGTDFLLTETGTLVASGKCLAVPSELLDVWSSSQVSAGFSSDNLPILSRYINETNQENLISQHCVESLDMRQVIETLKGDKRLPRPESWRQLLYLWHYVSPELSYPWHNNHGVKIVPAKGKEHLYSATEVVRLGEKRTLSPADYEFLAPHFSEIDPEWIKYVEDQVDNSPLNNNDSIKKQLKSAHLCLSTLGLDQVTQPKKFIGRVTESFLEKPSENETHDYVRLAHIAAKLGAAVPDSFKWVTQDAQIQEANENILVDIDGNLNMFVNKDWYKSNVLHEDYAKPSETCTYTTWSEWAQKNLNTFVPIVQLKERIQGYKHLKKTLRERGFEGESNYNHKYNNFWMWDWDFSPIHWDHWHSLASNNKMFWSNLMSRILKQPQSYWKKAESASVTQTVTSSGPRPVTDEQLAPKWIMEFRDRPCLLDTKGEPRRPAELLLRTDETYHFLSDELFVRKDLDTDSTKPLLKLLGVRDKLTDPKHILEQLQEMTNTNPPRLDKIKKLYRSLDHILDTCSVSETKKINTAFANSKLILTEQNEWARVDEVFLNPIDDLPKSMRIHSLLLDISLWRKIGIQEQPTDDGEIKWLKSLQSNEKPSANQIKRIHRMMKRQPYYIWNKTGHWLNIEKKWVPVKNLTYSLTKQSSPSSWDRLCLTVREKTADFQQLSLETCQNDPFAAHLELGNIIEEQIHEQTKLLSLQEKQWLIDIGTGLQRIVLDDPNKLELVYDQARRLSRTRWQVVEELKSIPYIDGKPVGTARDTNVLWRDDTLYVQEGPVAKMGKSVSKAIAEAFDPTNIKEAINHCYERPTEYIQEYLESNFKMMSYQNENEPNDRRILETQSDIEEEQGMIADPLQREHIQGEPTPSNDEDNDEGVKPMHKPRQPTGHTKENVIERSVQPYQFMINEKNRFDHTDESPLEKTLEEKDRTLAEKKISEVSITDLRKILTKEDKVKKNITHTTTYERDVEMIEAIKRDRNYECQVCHVNISRKNKPPYIEAAHITPKSKGGNESPSNIMILCPNHHTEFDKGDCSIVSRSTNEIIVKANGKTWPVIDLRVRT